MVKSPPPGVDADYIVGFFARNEAGLRRELAKALAAHQPRAVAQLDPADHRICASCGHVAHVDHLDPHLGMPSLGLTCPIAFGWSRIRPHDQLDQSLWHRFVAEQTASYGTCPECRGFWRLRPARDGAMGLVAHYRPPRRETEPRRRKAVQCEGSGQAPAAESALRPA